MSEITREQVDALYTRLKSEAESGGYRLNPDTEFTKQLVNSLLVNELRYGYWACPCRLASGIKAKDLDIICPCDYRDPDLVEYHACYCGLYVSQDIADGKSQAGSIPERRPVKQIREKTAQAASPAAGLALPSRDSRAGLLNLPFPVWRCKVCGYLCARENPPEICPVCKARKDRFERFI